MKSKIDSVCSGISSSAKETKKLSNKLINRVLVRMVCALKVKHIILVKCSQNIFISQLSIFQLDNLFLSY